MFPSIFSGESWKIFTTMEYKNFSEGKFDMDLLCKDIDFDEEISERGVSRNKSETLSTPILLPFTSKEEKAPLTHIAEPITDVESDSEEYVPSQDWSMNADDEALHEQLQIADDFAFDPAILSYNEVKGILDEFNPPLSTAEMDDFIKDFLESNAKAVEEVREIIIVSIKKIHKVMHINSFK